MGLHWNAFATLLLWFSWWGFNGGSTLALDERVGPIIINTNLGGAFGGIAAIVHCTLFEQRRELSSKFLNGILAGLVGVTAGCAVVTPLAAAAIGFGAGVIANLVTALLLRLRMDDPVGAVPVHLGGGIWGTLSVGLFARSDALRDVLHASRLQQIGAQLLGIVLCGLWVTSTAALTFLAIRRVIGLRVSPLEETEGFDLSGVVKKPDALPLNEAELLQLLGGEP
jgi:Amt family ammonium transporter